MNRGHARGPAFATALMTTTGATGATTVGDDALDRSRGDGFSDFALVFTDHAFGDGRVVSWETWIERVDGGASTGGMALLALEPLGGTNFAVRGVDARGAGVGLNAFTGGFAVEAGWLMGVWMGEAKVSYDLVGSNSAGPDDYTSNGLLSATPVEGQEIAFSGETDREYSLAATVAPVPLPPGAILIGAALLGAGALRRAAGTAA